MGLTQAPGVKKSYPFKSLCKFSVPDKVILRLKRNLKTHCFAHVIKNFMGRAPEPPFLLGNIPYPQTPDRYATKTSKIIKGAMALSSLRNFLIPTVKVIESVKIKGVPICWLVVSACRCDGLHAGCCSCTFLCFTQMYT